MPQRRLQHLFLLIALILYCSLAISSLRVKSATFDEGKHLPVGYSFLKLGDYRFDADNPALARMISAAPLMMMDIRVDQDDPTFVDGKVWRFGHKFLYDWNDADRLLFRGRLAIVLLGALLASAVFWWTRSHSGPVAGMVALYLCVLSPNILAHGRLATTDLPVTLFFFLSVVLFERATALLTGPRIVLAGLALGCALASKFSAVALLPILALLGAGTALRGPPLQVVIPGRSGSSRVVDTRRDRLLYALALLTAVGLIAVAVIWAVYRFRFAPSTDPLVTNTLDWGRLGLQQSLFDRLILAARDLHLLPEAYLYGFVDMLRRGQGHVGFLLGEHSRTGWWYFLPTTLLLKTPIPLLLLLALSIGTFWRRVPRTWRVEFFLWTPVVIYMTLAMSHRLSIGYRHLLPILPFLFVIAGRGFARLPWPPRRSLHKIGVGVLAAWYLVATLRVHPDYLTYFNELAGGPENGYRHLVDSNLDWGQDLKGLKNYMERENISDLKLSYFGSADPAYYGMNVDLLPGENRLGRDIVLVVRPGDLVAVSATNLQGVYLRPPLQPLMERLRALSPLAIIGHSIFVYRADFTWLLPPHAARELGWLAQAGRSYLDAVKRDPSFAEGFGSLGTALHISGRDLKAVEMFSKALTIDPRYFDGHPEQARAWKAAERNAGTAAPP